MAETNDESEAPEKATKKKATKAAKPPAPRAKKTTPTRAAVLVDAPARQGDSRVRVTFAAESSPKKRITSEERKRLISERAYAKAVERGFTAGNPRTDWLEAEREIDSELVGDSLARR